MKVVNNDILYNKDVLYFAPNDLSVRQKILYNILFQNASNNLKKLYKLGGIYGEKNDRARNGE